MDTNATRDIVVDTPTGLHRIAAQIRNGIGAYSTTGE
jgi:hypothetical protein